MGRTLLDIDWEKVDQLLISGQKGTEVAAYFGIHPNTFYRKVEEEKKISFSEYLQQKRAHGDGLLKAQQFAKAMGYTDKGDNTLLIWLGKTRLEQKEHVETIPNNDESLSKALDKIHSTDVESLSKKIHELQAIIEEYKKKEQANEFISQADPINPTV